MRRWLAVLALAGCDKIIGLQKPEFFDAPPAGLRDEDGDSIDDAEDKCPTVPDREQRNEDNDELGDACDPNPGMPGDRLKFYSFATDAQRADWQLDGTWELGNDVLAYRAADSNETDTANIRTIQFTPPYVVEARFTIDDLTRTPTNGFAVAANLDTLSQGVACSILRDQDGGKLMAYSMGQNNDTRPIPVATGMKYTVRLSFDLSNDLVICRADTTGGGTSVNADFPMSRERAGYAGVEGTRTDATVDSLVIYYR
jgi:hypothetical protein